MINYYNHTALKLADNVEMYKLLVEYGAEVEECEATESASECVTVDGNVVGAQCVFPFSYEGKTYCGCNADHEEEGVWCSTRTDEMGRHTQGHWGVCSEECPIEATATAQRG